MFFRSFSGRKIPFFKKVGTGFAKGKNAVSKAACSLKKNLFRGEGVLFNPETVRLKSCFKQSVRNVEFCRKTVFRMADASGMTEFRQGVFPGVPGSLSAPAEGNRRNKEIPHPHGEEMIDSRHIIYYQWIYDRRIT